MHVSISDLSVNESLCGLLCALASAIPHLIDLVDLAAELDEHIAYICLIGCVIAGRIEEALAIATVKEVYSFCWHHEVQKRVPSVVFLQNHVMATISITIVDQSLAMSCIRMRPDQASRWRVD